jgi:hypothetical protein
MFQNTRATTTPAVLAVAGLALAVGAAGRADAGIIVSNLADSPEFINDGTHKAQSFTIGNSKRVLSSVTLRLGNNSEDESATVTVRLFNNDSGEPGTQLQVLGTVVVTAQTGLKDYTLADFSRYTLLANTTYWIEAQAPDGPLQWAATTSTKATGLGTLGASADEDNGWTTDPGVRLELAVNSPSNPEPASWALLGVGAVALLGYTWRRRRTGA